MEYDGFYGNVDAIRGHLDRGNDVNEKSNHDWKDDVTLLMSTHSLTYLLTHWLTHSLTNLLTYSLTHLLTDSPTHSPTHSLTLTHSYSLTHSLQVRFNTVLLV